MKRSSIACFIVYNVEGPVRHLARGVGGQGFAEHLQRLILGRRGERKVAGVGQHFSRGHTLLLAPR